MRRISVFALLLAIASPALANSCPSLWAQIDERLQSAELSEADRADVVEHRTRGEALHTEGKHAESEAALNAALARLQ